jgi:hypothetical protein
MTRPRGPFRRSIALLVSVLLSWAMLSGAPAVASTPVSSPTTTPEAAGPKGAAVAVIAIFVHVSNPIAYDLKSLQTTRFSTKTNVGGAYAVLSVDTPNGPVYLYRGAIPTADTDFFFPLWNGSGNDGKRLKPSTYPWKLTLSKGGLATTTTRGKILVANITFPVNGVGTGMPQFYERHMNAGPANCYLTARTLAMTLTGPGGYRATVDSFACHSCHVVPHRTSYLRGATALKRRGQYVFTVKAPAGVHYYMSVVQ